MNVSLFKVCGGFYCKLLSHHTPWQNINNVPKFWNIILADWGKVFILRSIFQTGSFARVRKKECNPHTPKHIYFEENIPIDQGLVTFEASILSFFGIYSFSVSASSLVSAETPSADECMNRSKPKFQKIDWNEIKCLSRLKIWCFNPSSWQNLSEHVNLVHHEIFEK